MKQLIVDRPIDCDKFRYMFGKEVITRELALRTKTAFDEFLFGEINCDGTFSCYRHLRQKALPLDFKWYYIAILGRIEISGKQTIIEYSYEYNFLWRLARMAMTALFLLLGVYQLFLGFTSGGASSIIGSILVIAALFLGILIVWDPEKQILKKAIEKIINQC